jgi:hypothetical protein
MSKKNTHKIKKYKAIKFLIISISLQSNLYSSRHHSLPLIILPNPMWPIILNCCDPITHGQSNHTHAPTGHKNKPQSEYPFHQIE